ncbi:transcriptional regulator [Mycobacterium sp. E136]|uniref:BTAD domain-containing putative transcriptional regulator n=1 Tax=Mycobacterium sp. E136 TaxID=1834125 RepID=UPI0007FE2D25|nr:BTAD domain-containing putative transcriptional regulator [Mycobacterium sp. E136]OBG91612.1 transcriptional regulator [Mycobacterium sp. E136]
MAVQFRLLGDVEAYVDGARVEIGPSRQRCVLAALLVDLNRPVPSDQLIDRVWADDPPHRARNALAAYVSRLRHLLAGGVEITRGPGGYVLSADPTTVDVHLFRDLVAQARATADPGRADALFAEALTLWRGEPFATLETPWLDDVRRGLQAERLAAALDHNDIRLRVGRHGELIPLLTSLLRDHPLDERLASQLMLAQYRCGRQVDALNTFRTMRSRLVDELGVEPGPALRQVHQEILEGDPVQPPVRIVAEKPNTVPRRATSLIGRDDDLRRVVDALSGGPLITLIGVGGVGKTRLALEAASTSAEGFPDGAWVCELAPVEDEAAVAHAVAVALRLQQQQGLDIETTVIEYLRSRKLLVLLDNCEHVLDSAARLADRIVRHCPEVVVLTTSREALNVEGERLLPVPPLSLDDGVRLFAERARSGRPDFELESEPAGAVAEICRRLDGLPLAIELAAARMRAMSSIDVARRLDSLRLLSGGARDASPRQQSLTATIDWSYQLLTESEQGLFIRLSVFAGGFDLAAVHGVCGTGDEDDTLDLLTGLLDKSMVTRRAGAGNTRYAMLETLRAYGRNRLQKMGVDHDVTKRHARYYTKLAQRAAAEMHGPDEAGWVDRMLPDYDNIRTAFEHSVAAGDIDTAMRLVTSLSETMHLRIGYESAGWAERIVELADPAHPLYAAAVGFAARGAWNRGESENARALAELAAGRTPGRGNGRIAYPGDVLADLALYDGDPRTALGHYEAEMARARADDDSIRLVWTLFYVAICHAALRRPENGIAAAQEALRVADETSNPTARSMGRYALGLVLKKSDPERALVLFDDAAALAASVRNFWWHGIALMEAASTRAVHGEPRTAAAALIDVLDHWDRVGDWSQQWLNLRYITRFLTRMGADDAALTVHHALVDAGKPSPLPADRQPQDQRAVSGVEAVRLARSTLAAIRAHEAAPAADGTTTLS